VRIELFAGTAVVCLAGLLVLLPASAGVASGSASAPRAPGSDVERITHYDVQLALRPDGSMRVQETIDYDFGTQRRHGIYRTIPVESAYDRDHRRVYPISDIDVSSPTGAPKQTEVEKGATVTIKIGDPDIDDVTGKQTYVIAYDVQGVVNGFTDHQELYWNTVGSQWGVPIVRSTVSVEGPRPIADVACFQGAQGTTDQCPARIKDGAATYAATGLDSYQGMTVVASFPPGTFAHAEPILEEYWRFDRAFAVSPLSVGGSAALLGLVAGGAVVAVSQRGRDRRYLGLTPGLEPAPGEQARYAKVGMFRGDPVAVQFTPPKGVRPGQLGTLIDEEANVLDVTASIIDLAVRGYLRIVEVEKEHVFWGGDWRLEKLRDAQQGDLYPYERTLFRALFTGRDEVLLSDLRTTFSGSVKRVQGELYDDVTDRGWFHGNPRTVRGWWKFYAWLAIALGVVLTVVLAVLTSTHLGLVGVSLVVAGFVMLSLAGRRPARTAAGTAVLAQVKGFELYLRTAEADQLRFEEHEDIFSRYLPYAIVFGVAERWAAIFARLAATGLVASAPNWYVGTGYDSNGLFDYHGFGGSVDALSVATSGAIAAPAPSSSGGSGYSGGFSGGGAGGGGGGSW
jgi:uncharacterized protein (TIGR04222 family)